MKIGDEVETPMGIGVILEFRTHFNEPAVLVGFDGRNDIMSHKDIFVISEVELV